MGLRGLGGRRCWEVVVVVVMIPGSTAGLSAALAEMENDSVFPVWESGSGVPELWRAVPVYER